MKRVFTIIILMLALVVEGQSQTGLQIAELFNGSYKRKDNAIEVVVKGNQLERYRLKVFRSLTVKNDPKDFERIEGWWNKMERRPLAKRRAVLESVCIMHFIVSRRKKSIIDMSSFGIARYAKRNRMN